MNTTTNTGAASLSDEEKSEILDWVSACQSAYHIDSTPGHQFGGLGSNLEDNRAELIAFVEGIVSRRATPTPQKDDVPSLAKSISDEMMDLVDRLGSEYDKVDPRAWDHLTATTMTDETMQELYKLARSAHAITDFEIKARAILARQPAAIDKHAVPEGWKLVPVDPTPKMIDEAKRYTWVAEEDATEAGIWRHMLAASPPAPSVEQDERGAFERALISYAMDEAESTDAEVIRQSRARIMALFDAARAASTSANVAQGAEAESGKPVAKIMRGECHEGTYPHAQAVTIVDADWEHFPDGTLLYTAPPAQTAITTEQRSACTASTGQILGAAGNSDSAGLYAMRQYPAVEASALSDADRFRFLVEDIQDSELRRARNELLDRMAVMSYSAVCLQIDAALTAAQSASGETK